MQNPDLIHQIENLAKQDANTKEENAVETKAEPPIPGAAESTQAAAVAAQSTGSREKRTRLLSALRPYVSEKRSKTLDTLIGAMDIFDLIGRG